VRSKLLVKCPYIVACMCTVSVLETFCCASAFGLCWCLSPLSKKVYYACPAPDAVLSPSHAVCAGSYVSALVIDDLGHMPQGAGDVPPTEGFGL
jgi:hypothetical protein